MREIKFRAWNKAEQVMQSWESLRTHSLFQLITDKRLILREYTGKKDSNGGEVYEGDLLDVDGHKRIVEVVWFAPQACFDTRPVKVLDKHEAFRGLQNSDWPHRTVIVGNIYENPELLNKGETV